MAAQFTSMKGPRRGFLLTQVNGTPIRGTFAGYCDAVRSVKTGQTAVLTVVVKPGAGHFPDRSSRPMHAQGR